MNGNVLVAIGIVIFGAWWINRNKKAQDLTQPGTVTPPYTGIPPGIYTGEDTSPWIVSIETYYNGVPYGYDINPISPTYQQLMPYV